MNPEAVYQQVLLNQVEELTVRQVVATVHGRTVSIVEVQKEKIQRLIGQIEMFVRLYRVDRTKVGELVGSLERQCRELEHLAAQYQMAPDGRDVEQAHDCELYAQKIRLVIHALMQAMHQPDPASSPHAMYLIEREAAAV